VWLTAFGVILGGGVALFARPLLVLVFGARYGGAAAPLVVLALATVLIAPAGVLGTALIAVGNLRPLAIQVGVSLVVNVVVLVVLVPSQGASGAAAATLACETVALVLLARTAARSLPGLAAFPRFRAPVSSAIPVKAVR
jgi:O-antigen/teichoic acid export membrane protein